MKVLRYSTEPLTDQIEAELNRLYPDIKSITHCNSQPTKQGNYLHSFDALTWDCDIVELDIDITDPTRFEYIDGIISNSKFCLLYTSPSPRD